MAISRSVAGNNACPARVIGYIRMIPPLVFLVDHGHVRSHRLVREVIIKSMAACHTLGPPFTLPMVRLSAHPIPEDIVRTRSIWIRGQEPKFSCSVDRYGHCEVSLALPSRNPRGIVTLDVVESSEVAQDPTGREAIERQFGVPSPTDTQVTSIISFRDKIRSVEISLPL